MPRWPLGLHQQTGSQYARGGSAYRMPVPPIEDYTGVTSRVPLNDGQGQAIVGVAGNGLTGASAGFEQGTAGTWTQRGGCSIAATQLAAHTGGWSLALTDTVAGNMSAASSTAAGITSQGLPVAPGQTVYCQAWLLAATTGRVCFAGAQFYTAAGVVISELDGPTVNDVTTGWTLATAAVVAPATAAFARLIVQVNAAGLGEVHYTDDTYLSLSPISYGALVQVGPQGLGTVWYPAAVTVSTTSGVNDNSVANVYAGPAYLLTPTQLLGTIPNGGAGVLSAAVPPLPVGWYLTVIWTGANLGDVAAVNITGSKDARVRG